MTARAHTIKIAEVVRETADARTLVFDIPDDLTARFSYRPGQFLTLRVPSERTGSVARCYSLCSSPHCDDRLAVTVKRTAGGYASNLLCDITIAGDPVTVLEPLGTFGPRGLDGDLLLAAGGSGITPIMSIIKSVLVVGRGSVVLLYANRDRRSVIFGRELAELERRHPKRLRVLHWWESDRGLPTSRRVAEALRRHRKREWYICGPLGFTTVLRSAAASLRVPTHQIHLEEFRSLASNPFEEPTPPRESATRAPLTTAAPGRSAALEVDIDGRTHHFRWPRTERLLDVLLNNGINAPYVCRESACGTCVCAVKRGRTRMVRNEALIDAELEQGLTLACQTLPESDDVRITFEQ
ncbi:ferredoxin--NADP reductase [Nocardia uniformis]|uniref:Ferredoxin--NADP reductase n=1 Tax=Nocardia uniformis TaxID=53432 RepID=A0A849BUJ3_9NOCA|nr:ferredoxin--NADP reductase [Nocardia uniformis]NNH68708.1 ferredoxin--NADP reductase [Nocardia uniformis]